MRFGSLGFTRSVTGKLQAQENERAKEQGPSDNSAPAAVASKALLSLIASPDSGIAPVTDGEADEGDGPVG